MAAKRWRWLLWRPVWWHRLTYKWMFRNTHDSLWRLKRYGWIVEPRPIAGPSPRGWRVYVYWGDSL